MLRIGRYPYLSSPASDEPAQEEDDLRRILWLLRGRNRTDFSRYKRSTVQRRLARRMALREVDGLADYAELLDQDPGEVEALAQDFLIRVTGFFDPETFIGSSETVFPALLENRSPKDPLRIGSPAAPPEKRFIPSRLPAGVPRRARQRDPRADFWHRSKRRRNRKSSHRLLRGQLPGQVGELSGLRVQAVSAMPADLDRGATVPTQSPR
jgi:CheR methyltransferase, all-alpha domain